MVNIRQKRLNEFFDAENSNRKIEHDETDETADMAYVNSELALALIEETEE